jgi:hypothetical protein
MKRGALILLLLKWPTDTSSGLWYASGHLPSWASQLQRCIKYTVSLSVCVACRGSCCHFICLRGVMLVVAGAALPSQRRPVETFPTPTTSYCIRPSDGRVYRTQPIQVIGCVGHMNLGHCFTDKCDGSYNADNENKEDAW